MGFSVEEEDENDSDQNISDNEELEEQKQPLKLHRRFVNKGRIFWKSYFAYHGGFISHSTETRRII